MAVVVEQLREVWLALDVAALLDDSAQSAVPVPVSGSLLYRAVDMKK